MYISPVSSSSATTFHFLGTGYAAISRIPNYNSREFQITFQFKTFWANSTLLFAGNEAMVCIPVLFYFMRNIVGGCYNSHHVCVSVSYNSHHVCVSVSYVKL